MNTICGDAVRSSVVKNCPYSLEVQMIKKQDLEAEEMWSGIEIIKYFARLCAEVVGVMITLDGMRRLGSEILGSWTYQ